jgi:hypothetical protein
MASGSTVERENRPVSLPAGKAFERLTGIGVLLLV